MRFWVLPSSVLALVCMTTPARAVSDAALCSSPTVVYPSSDRTLPANAPALVLRLASNLPPPTMEELALELRGPDGAPLAVEPSLGGGSTERLVYIRPGAELPLGTSLLSFRDFCSRAPEARLSYPIQVVSASPLPDRIGEVRMEVVEPFGPGCQGYPAQLQVEVTPSPELLAYSAVAAAVLRWKVDTISSTPFGAGWSGGRMRTTLPGCSGSTEIEEGRLTVVFHIAGAASDPPPVELDVSLRCPSQAGRPPCEAGAPPDETGRPSPDGDPRSPTDGGALDAAATPKPRAGGCAMSPLAPGPSLPALTLLPLLVLLAGLTRRRR
jgi:hypothetical protein